MPNRDLMDVVDQLQTEAITDAAGGAGPGAGQTSQQEEAERQRRRQQEEAERQRRRQQEADDQRRRDQQAEAERRRRLEQEEDDRRRREQQTGLASLNTEELAIAYALLGAMNPMNRRRQPFLPIIHFG
jgi:colicin import membrane protein